MAVRVLPLFGAILFFGIGVVWRVWLQYRRHGHTGVTLFRSGGWAQMAAEGGFCLILLAVMAQPLAFAVWPSSLSWAMLVTPPPWLAWAGTLVTVLGIAFMVAAQVGMGGSWRIGIDEGATPGLVTGGLYAFCRNPIYLGMFVALAGMALALPTALSVAHLLLIVAGVRYQVGKEEEYLLKVYRQGFRSYASRVGRFVPGLGTMA
jgi:protein-S-isoprenylcysteine O-methyltransferase Ste14